jgi:hypothetical protein
MVKSQNIKTTLLIAMAMVFWCQKLYAQFGVCKNGTPVLGTEFCSGWDIDSVSYGFGLSISDLDNDGVEDDIVVSDIGTPKEGPSISWYKYNKKLKKFEKTIVYIGTEIFADAWFEYNHIQDIDNDGYKDIVVVSNYNPPTVFWLKNPGKEIRKNEKWKPLPVAHALDKNSLKHNSPRPYMVTTIPNNTNTTYYDIIVGPQSNGANATDIEVYINPLGQYSSTTAWEKQPMGFSFCDRVSMIQLFSDKELQLPGLFVTALSDDYSYDFHKRNGVWKYDYKEDHVDGTIRAPAHGSFADIDGDHHQDVVVAAGYRYGDFNAKCRQDRPKADKTNLIVWYEKDPIKGWMQNIIKSNFYYAFSAVAGDFKGNGRDDVVIANSDTSRKNDIEQPASEIMLCQNPDKAEFRTQEWPCISLAKDLPAASFLAVSDIDNDGDKDIIGLAVGLRDSTGTNIHFGKILFFENTRKK